MARTSTKTTKTTRTTKTAKPVKIEVEEETQSRTGLFDYLRFGESYTSLILGIIVVIISTVLLLSFVNSRNSEKDTPQLLSQKDINLPTGPITSEAPVVEEQKETPTNTPVPTKAPVATPTDKPAPTKIVAQAKPTATPTVTPTPVKVAQAQQGTVNPATGEYTVAAGDNLWKIAEKQYKSGYNWVDIARANKLTNPGQIAAGQKLKMPKVEQKVATVTTTPSEKETVAQTGTKITGDTYTIVKGDTLWSIAVRAYGDGYQWKKIADANKLTNPSLIHSQNKLKIPRG